MTEILLTVSLNQSTDKQLVHLCFQQNKLTICLSIKHLFVNKADVKH